MGGSHACVAVIFGTGMLYPVWRNRALGSSWTARHGFDEPRRLCRGLGDLRFVFPTPSGAVASRKPSFTWFFVGAGTPAGCLVF